MKKFLALLIIVILGVWGYRSCANKKTEDTDVKVLKQVKVTAMSANLRTGPGTSYDYATVNADGTGGKWKLKRGTVLDVVEETAHWYEVRLEGDTTRTAYIKKTLCADYDKSQDKTSGKNKKEKSSSQKKADNKVDQPSTNDTDNDVVEEVTKGKPQDDDVIF